MSVHLLYGDIDRPLGVAPKMRDTLFGKPFPSDEVQAYWSMVPEDIVITVQWFSGLGLFQVKRLIKDNSFDDEGHDPVEKVFANDAHKLSVWMDVIGRLARVP